MDYKTDFIRFRVTPQQKEKVYAAAEALGITVSAYIGWKLGITLGDMLADKFLEGSDSKRK